MDQQAQDAMNLANDLQDQNIQEINKMFGIGLTIFIVCIIIHIIVSILLIWFAIFVFKKCRSNPSWLSPTVITLLVLFILIGWFPVYGSFIGFLIFVALLIILIIFANKCSNGQRLRN